MNYKRIYDSLIESARIRETPVGYYETHHIVPRCMGGGNEQENLVRLTAREHYVAHHLLYRHYKTPKLAYAWVAMCMNGTRNERTISSRQYEKARIAISEQTAGVPRKPLSEPTKRKISESNKGKKRTAETKKKLSEARKRRGPASEETRQKISATGKGRPSIWKGKTLSEEHRKKMSLAQKGKVVSEETRKRLSEAMKRSRANKLKERA
jgi:hypothetical protein